MRLYILRALLRGDHYTDAGLTPVSDAWLADIRRRGDDS